RRCNRGTQVMGLESTLEKITMTVQPPAVCERPAEREDALLLCLVIISRLYGVPKSPTALAAGLPIAHKGLTPDLLVQSSDRIGLPANVTRRPFKSIAAVSLPCVLLLKDGHACVFLRRVDDRLAEIATPEHLDGSNHVPLADLAERYAGSMIVVRPKI